MRPDLQRRNPLQPLYSTLSRLHLFNTICGDDDLTNHCDYKHIGKRFRNSLIRLKGLHVAGVSITRAIIKSHLLQTGMPEATVDGLLSPDDRQDCVLMFRLLNGLAQLPDAPVTSSPSFQASRRILQLLGYLYSHILYPYIDVSLSLHDQLVHLSAAAHLMLILYSCDKVSLMPVQLYFDTMCMIKNA